MVSLGASAILPGSGRAVVDQWPTALSVGGVASEAVMSSATLGST